MQDLNRLSINQLTTRDQWSLPEAVNGYARAGAMAVWWEKLREVGTERAARAIRDAGMAVTGYCAGGMLTARDDAHWRQRLDDNRRMIDEAAAIGSSCLVALGGGLVRCARRRPRGRNRGRYLQRVVGPGARYPDRARRRTHRGLPCRRLAARYERSALRSGDAGRRGDRFPAVRGARHRGRHEVEILSNQLVAEEPRDSRDDGARTLPQRDVAGSAARCACARPIAARVP